MEDAAALLDIYKPYVINTAVTFECTPPSVEEFKNRIMTTLERYPYLAAQKDGKVVGYAYAGPLKGRAAYIHSVELSVYVKSDVRGMGIGGLLYDALEKILAKQNVMNLYACIAYTERKDAHLNSASCLFHEKRGFKTAGRFNGCGVKFGKRYDVLWMEKIIADKETGSFIPYSDLE